MEMLGPFRHRDISQVLDECAELKPLCKAIVTALPAEQRKILEEYHQLLLEREAWNKRNAYISGIQIGRQQAKRENL